jgi:tetratricopeptide (TPR) repeat protein
MAARTADGLNRAVELFKQAVERDPDFALAFSGLSDAYNLLGMNKMKEPAEALRLAEEYAVKALALDPDSVEARISLAMAKFRRTKDAAEAERLFLRANEINPRHATARHWYAVILGETGRYQEAVRQLQIAAEIEPRSAVIQSALALTYLKMNRQDDVIFHAERAIELESRLVNAYAAKSIVLQQRGDYEAARENFRQAHIINGGGATEPFWLIAQAFAHAAAGRKSEALATFDRLSKTPTYRKSPENFIPDAAILHHLLGDDDRAFEWLRKIEVKNRTLIDTVKSDARLAKLREDSRFAELIEKWNTEAGSK